ncbi:MAG: hypothetical protein N2447_07560 [Thermoanaerobaculum sp.]|nr:hypothetical protein [Thermoanaerobaculum sp.]
MGRRFALVLSLFLTACTTLPRGRGLLPPLRPEQAPGEPLTRSQQKTAVRLWTLADAGDVSGAKKLFVAFPPQHPLAELLQLGIAFGAGEPNLWPRLAAFAQAHPRYPTGWELALLAGEREGQLLGAAEAAQQLAQLTGQASWERRRTELVERFVRAAEEETAKLMAAGQAAAALETARRALEHAPQLRSLREVAVRAALAAGNTEAAKLLVLPLPEDEGGLLLKAEVAGVEGKWELAATLYRRLPPQNPTRCLRVREAEERARWQSPPALVRAAAQSPRLARGELAVLLLFYFPQLAEKAAGPVPLYEDLVGHAAQREVLILVQAGILQGDPLTRRVFPARAVTGQELQGVLTRLLAVLGFSHLNLCLANQGNAQCLQLPAGERGITGGDVVRLLARMWELTPC